MKLTGLKGRIPVEPLDDERLTNIERRIVTGAADAAARGRDVRAPRFGFAMAIALTVVVAIGAGFAGWKLRGGGTTAPVATAEPVRVDTSSERTVLDIGDARIESDPHTDFTITRPDGGVLVTMKRGKVELQVDKRGDRAPLVVAAGDTRVTVVGTQFSVDYGDGTGPVEVRVTEGIVKVERLQQEVRLAAGQAWTTKLGAVAIAALPSMKLASAGGTNPGATNPDTTNPGATIGAPDPRVDDKIEIDTSTPDVLRERQANVPDAKLPQVQPVKKQPIGGPEITRQPRDEGSASTSATVDLRKQIFQQPVLPPKDLGLRPEETMAQYNKIAYTERGREAALALYSIAYQQAMKLGRTADALQTIDAYTRRFSGTEYKDTYQAALWLRVRISCAKTFDDACRQAAYTHMHQATGTPAAKVSELLTLAPR
jgi:FecR protein